MGASTANATVTAPIGAGEVATAIVLNDIREFRVDVEHEMLYVTTSDGREVEFAYDTIATLTWTIANNVATIAVST